MTNIAGVYRNGVIELDGPPPADWQDGQQVCIPSEDIEPSDEVWEEEFRQIHAMLADDGFYEELKDTLAKNKAEELAFWNSANAKLDRIGS
jgi:hypothetical protein